jgi:hypothetical protein
MFASQTQARAPPNRQKETREQILADHSQASSQHPMSSDERCERSVTNPTRSNGLARRSFRV